MITRAECDASKGALHRETGLSGRRRFDALAKPRASLLPVSGIHPALIVDERLTLADPSQILHDAGALVGALRGCSYERLALVTHHAVVLAMSSIFERIPIAGLVNRNRRECSIAAYRREGGAIRRIA